MLPGYDVVPGRLLARYEASLNRTELRDTNPECDRLVSPGLGGIVNTTAHSTPVPHT